jgi:hypothetical protein
MEGKFGGKTYVLMYENGTIRTVEIILKKKGWRIKGKDGGGRSTKMYS